MSKFAFYKPSALPRFAFGRVAPTDEVFAHRDKELPPHGLLTIVDDLISAFSLRVEPNKPAFFYVVLGLPFGLSKPRYRRVHLGYLGVYRIIVVTFALFRLIFLELS